MFFIIIGGLYLAFVGLIVALLHWRGVGTAWKVGACILLLLAPFSDIFITKGIMQYFKMTHSPLQQISKTIEKPGSVLWLDEVWPGFDEYGRRWMVSNYLDGTNLQMLALNDGKGKLYLYQASPEDYLESAKLRPEIMETEKTLKAMSDQMHRDQKEKKDVSKSSAKFRKLDEAFMYRRKAYEQVRKDEIAKVMARVKVYQPTGNSLPADLPPFAYQVQIQRLRLPEWQEKFTWCDEIEIFDNQKNEEIAFSKRCLGYSPKFGINPLGSCCPFHGGSRLGDEHTYGFDDKVLFGYANVRSSYESDRNNLERK